MSEANHTPGPWRTVRGNAITLDGRTLRIVWAKDGADVAYCPDTDTDGGNANAQLISMAPMFLNTLKILWDERQEIPEPVDDPVRELVTRVIAMAEGGTA